MTYHLKITLDPGVQSNAAKNKRLWNFAKAAVKQLLSSADFADKIAVSQPAAHSFILSHHLSGQEYLISHDLAFAQSLELALTEPTLMIVILAVVIRLEKLYINAFKVSCDSYSVVESALHLLEKELQMKVTRNWLSTFIDCPWPGRKPRAAKALTGSEKQRELVRKKRAEGKAPVTTWLDESVKKELDAFCKMQGVSLEEALNKIIPAGLNITSYFLKNDAAAIK